MRRLMIAAVALATLGLSPSAGALPKGAPKPGGVPGGPGGGGKPMAMKLRVPASFGSRMAQPVKKNGASLTRAQVMEKFDPDSEVDIDGTKIKVQDLLDRFDDAEKEVAKQGGSFTQLKKTAWLKSGTVAKLSAQKGALGAEVKELVAARPTLPKAGAIDRCAVQACAPSQKEKSIRWDKQKGDEDTVAVYTSFSVTEQSPDSDLVRCTANWDNGLYFLGDKKSLVKLTAEASSQKKPQVLTAGKVALYVTGQATPTWSKEGRVTGDSLDRTFKTPKAKLNVPFIPLVSVEGSVWASATLGLKPTVTGDGDAKTAGCNVGLTPRLSADVNPEVKMSVGIPRIVSLVSGGVRAQLTVIDLSIPTMLGVRMTEQPMSLGLKFKSDLNVTFLKGKVVAWYKIKDACAFGYCLIEDGLGIDTSGEVELWEDADGIPYAQNLVDLNGTIPFSSGPASMGGLAR